MIRFLAFSALILVTASKSVANSVIRDKLYAWYSHEDIPVNGTGSWESRAGNFTVTTMGSIKQKYSTGIGTTRKLNTYSGDENTTLDFGQVLPDGRDYTICSLSRYSGIHRKRILSTKSTDQDILIGHWNNFVACSRKSQSSCDSKGQQEINTFEWIWACGNRYLFIRNGKEKGSLYTGSYMKPVTNFYVNGIESQKSDWEVAELIVWNKLLTTFEMRMMTTYLKQVLAPTDDSCSRAPKEMVWNKALRVDGTKMNFNYKSSLWTNYDKFDSEGELKTEYFFQSFQALKLRMLFPNGGEAREIFFPIQGNSLREIFDTEKNLQTYAPVTCWRDLYSGSSWQPNCNKQGINIQVSSNWSGINRIEADKIRIGILMNEQNDCHSGDIAFGLGILMKWDTSAQLSAGNYVWCCASKGFSLANAGVKAVYGELWVGTIKEEAAGLLPYSQAEAQDGCPVDHVETKYGTNGELNNYDQVTVSSGSLNKEGVWTMPVAVEAYWQLNLTKNMWISGVETSGIEYFVRSYTLKTSSNNNIFTEVDNGREFDANYNSVDSVTHRFVPIFGQYLRIYPKLYQTQLSLRAGVLVSSCRTAGNIHNMFQNQADQGCFSSGSFISLTKTKSCPTSFELNFSTTTSLSLDVQVVNGPVGVAFQQTNTSNVYGVEPSIYVKSATPVEMNFTGRICRSDGYWLPEMQLTHSNLGDWVTYAEIEKISAVTQNLSSSIQNFNATLCTDDDFSSQCATQQGIHNWLDLDLGANKSVGSVKFWQKNPVGHYTIYIGSQNSNLQSSGISYTECCSGNAGDGASVENRCIGLGRYVRLKVAGQLKLVEMQVFENKPVGICGKQQDSCHNLCTSVPGCRYYSLQENGCCFISKKCIAGQTLDDGTTTTRSFQVRNGHHILNTSFKAYGVASVEELQRWEFEFSNPANGANEVILDSWKIDNVVVKEKVTMGMMSPGVYRLHITSSENSVATVSNIRVGGITVEQSTVSHISSRYWDGSPVTSSVDAKFIFAGASDVVIAGRPGYCENLPALINGFDHNLRCGAFNNVAVYFSTVVNISVSTTVTFTWTIPVEYGVLMVDGEDGGGFRNTETNTLSVTTYLEAGQSYALEGYGFSRHLTKVEWQFRTATTETNAKVVDSSEVKFGSTTLEFRAARPLLRQVSPISGHTDGGYQVTAKGKFFAKGGFSKERRRGVRASFYAITENNPIYHTYYYPGSFVLGQNRDPYYLPYEHCSTVVENIDQNLQTDKTIKCEDGTSKTFPNKLFIAYRGFLKIDVRGSYEFQLGHTDAMVLELSDFILIKNWRNSAHHFGKKKSAKVVLYKGYYPFRVSYKYFNSYDKNIVPIAQLSWKKPNSQLHEIIPLNNYFLDEQNGDSDKKCSRPDNWCQLPNVFEWRDCDGDGILDPTCSQGTSFGAIQSALLCSDSWPSGTCAYKGSVSVGLNSGYVQKYSENEMTFLAPEGQCMNNADAGNSPVKITAITSEYSSSNEVFFTYLSPVVDTANIALQTGGDKITITGKNFGQTPQLVIQDVNTSLATLTSDGDGNGVVVFDVKPVAGSPKSGSFTVGCSSVQYSLNWAAPVLGTFSPASMKTEEIINTSVTFTGTNLGSSPTILVGGMDCTCAKTNDFHTEVQCTLPSDAYGSSPISIRRDGQTFDSYRNYVFESPAIQSLTPDIIGVLGSNITIQGTSFSTENAMVQIGGILYKPVSQNHTQIVCEAPKVFEADSYTVTVQTGTTTSNPATMLLEAPSVEQISTSTPVSTLGGNITVRGRDFANDCSLIQVKLSPLSKANVTLADLDCSPKTCSSDTVVCSFSQGHAGQKASKYKVIVARRKKQGELVFKNHVFAGPKIEKIEPLTPVGCAGGTTITVSGKNFGSAARGTVTIGASICSIQNWEATVITCQAPAYNLIREPSVKVVLLDGFESNSTITILYALPSIVRVLPATGPTIGRTQIAIEGSDFTQQGIVKVGGVQVEVSKRGNKLIQFTAPAGTGLNVPLEVLVNGGNDSVSTSSVYSYDPPTLVKLKSGSRLGPTAGGKNLIFEGTNFGNATDTILVVGNKTANATHVNDARTEATFTAPANVGLLSIQIRVNNQKSVEEVRYAHDDPIICKIQSTNCTNISDTAVEGCPISEHTITVVGQNFGTDLVQVSVKIYRLDNPGDSFVNCTLVSVANSEIECKVPANAKGGFKNEVEVTVAGQVSLRSAGQYQWVGAAINFTTVLSGKPNDNLTMTSSSACIGNVAQIVDIRLGSSTEQFSQKRNFTNCEVMCPETIICKVPADVGKNLKVQGILGSRLTSPSLATFTYNLFALTPKKLRDAVNDTATVDENMNSHQYQPPANVWKISFNIVNWYLADKELDGTQKNILVTYDQEGGNSPYICTMVTVSVSGRIDCFTSPANVSTENFFFTVTAYPNDAERSVSVTATDILKLPTPPVITAIRSLTCNKINGQGVGGCPTEGNYEITVFGTSFTAYLPVVTVGGLTCPIVTTNTTQIKCRVPAGTGTNIPIVVTTSTGSYSNPNNLFSYEIPEVNKLSVGWNVAPGVFNGTANCAILDEETVTLHKCADFCEKKQQCNVFQYKVDSSNCQMYYCESTNVSNVVPATDVYSHIKTTTTTSDCSRTTNHSLELCPREGGATINLFGTNFGFHQPAVLVCELQCTEIEILVPHRHVTCKIPEGVSLNNEVALLQAGGALARKPWPNIAYTPCQRGTFGYTHNNTVCQQCVPGSFSAQEGLLACDLCPAGRSQPASGESQCNPCTEGRAMKKTGAHECNQCTAGLYANDKGLSECLECDKGKYTETLGNTRCVSCQGGKAQSQKGQTQCDPCATGNVPSRDKVSCDPCPNGFFTNNSQSCSRCDPGKTSQGGADRCDDCDKGEEQPLPGKSACTPCQPGTQANQMGTPNCVQCIAGRFSDAEYGFIDCTACPMGKNSALSGAGSCTKCDSGRFANVTGLIQCLPCDKGYYGPNMEASTCVECPAGSFNGDLEQPTCTPCEAGSYSPATKATTCTLCELGKFQSTNGKSKCDNCTKGQYTTKLGGILCVNCPPGRFSNLSGVETCKLCTPGRYNDATGRQDCTSCPAGKYQDVYGQIDCKPCAKGFFNGDTTKTVCEKCLAGSFTGVFAKTVCDKCDAGRFSNVKGTSACSQCDKGKVSAENGSQSCENCPKGRSRSTKGGTQCTICPVGQFADYEGKVFCDQCPAGTYNNRSEVSVCTDCSAGRFTDTTGRTKCVDCPAGKNANTAKASMCTDCLPGTFSNTIGAIRCVDCPGGKSQDLAAAKGCNVCPIGTAAQNASKFCSKCPNDEIAPEIETIQCSACASNSLANNEGTACLCDVGFAELVQAEIPSYTTTYSPTRVPTRAPTRAPSMSPTFAPTVPLTESPTTTSQSPTMLVGTSAPTSSWSDGSDSEPNTADTQGGNRYGNRVGKCVKCPEGAVCNARGLNWLKLETKEGWFQKNNEWLPCLLVTDCAGGAPIRYNKMQAATLCDQDPSLCMTTGYVNNIYTKSPCPEYRIGDLCARCTEDPPTTKSIGGTCIKCDDNKAGSYTWMILVAIAFLIGFCTLYGIIIFNGNVLIKAAQHEVDVLKEHSNNPVAALNAVTEDVHEYYRHGNMVTIQGAPAPRPNFTYKVKIAVGFVQIMSNLLIGLDIPWPNDFKEFLQLFNIFNLDFFAGASVDCIIKTSHYLKVWAYIISPFAAVVLLYCLFLLPQYCMSTGRENGRKRKAARQRFWSLVMFTLFLIYPTISSTILRLYQCREYYGIRYLRADTRVICTETNADGTTSDWYSNITAAIPFAVIIPLGIPAFMFYKLYKKRFRLNELSIRAELGFLYDAYERKIWFWELVDMSHKLSIVALVAFVPDKQMQLAVAITIAFSYMAGILILKPYLKKSDDRVHQFAQMEIIFSLLSAFWLGSLDDPLSENEERLLSVVLILVCFVFFFFFAVALFWSFVKVFNRHPLGKRFHAGCRRLCCCKLVYKYFDNREARLKKDIQPTGEEFYEGVLNLVYKAKKLPLSEYIPDYEEEYGANEDFTNSVINDVVMK